MAVTLQSYFYNADGTPVASATVEAFAAVDGVPGGAPTSSTTTDANGKWTISGLVPANYDIKITKGAQVRWFKGKSSFQGLALIMSGLLSERPAAGQLGRLYRPTDQPGRLDYDNGTSWETIAYTAFTDPLFLTTLI